MYKENLLFQILSTHDTFSAYSHDLDFKTFFIGALCQNLRSAGRASWSCVYLGAAHGAFYP
jgi:hypothetical protein